MHHKPTVTLRLGLEIRAKVCISVLSGWVMLGIIQNYLDDRQITYLICVRLRHVLYDFLGGVWAMIFLGVFGPFI